MKTNNSHPTLPHGRQSGGLILNVGIGIVLGLLAALLAVFLVMKGGPFKDRANTNTITPQTGQAADPNTPLYGAQVAPIDLTAVTDSKTPPSSENGEGVGSLTGNNNSSTPTPAVKSATKETAKPVVTPASDPVAAMINAATGNKTTPQAEKKAAVKTEPAPDAKPATKPTAEAKPTAATTDSKPKVSTNNTTNNTATTTKTATPNNETKPPQKTATVKSSNLPKEVKPATAP